MTCNITHLMILKDQKIALFRIHNYRLQHIEREGEKFFNATEDFWEWWQEVAEYIQGDSVDLAFVWDIPSPLIVESAFYEPLKQNTQWRQEIILGALSLAGLEDLQLQQHSQATEESNTESNRANVLFTNIEITAEAITPRDSKRRRQKKEVKIPKIRGQETPAQRYYREWLEEKEREREEKLNGKSH